MRIIVAVVGSYGNGLLQRLGDVLASRFQEQPERWPPWLKLEIAEQLLAAGAGAAWYRETLAVMERNAVPQDVQSRMEVLADLVIRYARIGEMEDARRLASRLVVMAFGVGYRKDYQFDSWVTWLGRALAEPDGDGFMDDAIWLARLLKAAEPMSEHAALSAETDLPAAVAVAAPIPAVRMFEYFVRHGTVNHLDALAALVKALVTHAETDDESTVRLAADMTSYLIAPASNSAYSDLGESLVRAAKGTSGSATATSLAKSVATRTDIFALRTTRSTWRTSLGLLPTTNNKGKSVRGASNQTEANDLILVDGRNIPPNEVASRIHSVADIVELRNQEAGDSAFQWGPIIAQQELTSGVVRTLSGAFDSESRIDVQVLVSLAEVAERNGDRSTAKRLAADIIRATHGDGWHSGGASRRAAAVAVRLDAEDIRVAVCKDLVRRATAHRWFPGELFWQLDSIVTTLAPNLAAATTWPEIKAYLEGMAQTFDLAKDDVTTDHGCHWWLVDKTDDQRSPSNDDSPAAALAELAVGHLSHPTWIVRDAATSIVFRALQAENEHVIGALASFAQHDASHDTLERAGRCLAAARTKAGYRTPAALQPLDDTLANHTSQILRDLAAGQPREPYRPLSPLYRLSLPPPLHDPIGAERAMSPYDELYGPLASESKLDVNTLQAVAARYISDALTALPDNEAVLAALISSGMQHLYPHQEAVAARTAFGRVLADLTDAGRLDHMPVHLRRRLRTSDVDVLTRIPRARPEVIPSPPEAGHSQTIVNWQEGIESRLDEYVTASGSGPYSVLIGAKTRLMVLNWGNVQEKLLCGTTVGTDQRPSSEILARQAPMVLKDLLDTATSNMPVDGDPLVVQNPWYPFHEPRAGWLAFRPDLAATLGWRPDAAEPGRWRTTSGKLAVESIWWIDGWWGRSTKAFDDTQAYGHAVVLTAEGLTDITAAFGKATRHFLLSREGKDDGTEVEPVSATRFMPLLWRPRPDDRDT